ncbi:hypothetical protein [Shimazuella alba]|uniref:Uncharacterized protein n=1 Tax=Shimazuella alba TaxID=2690964 RepID=A0A6I4VUB5_9BACL|nr:hypothetical protein [Shimazuella alba]MXQ53765.1 hypothetical protein [Shimazuella alba]
MIKEEQIMENKDVSYYINLPFTTQGIGINEQNTGILSKYELKLGLFQFSVRLLPPT